MKDLFKALIKLIMFACLAGGAYLVYNSKEQKAAAKKKMELESNNPKALALKKFLLTFNKPARVEIFNYTKKYDKDVNEILEMKISTDPNSNFYITIQFFTDETDSNAPLVAQVRFIDMNSDNLIKEQSINLE